MSIQNAKNFRDVMFIKDISDNKVIKGSKYSSATRDTKDISEIKLLMNIMDNKDVRVAKQIWDNKDIMKGQPVDFRYKGYQVQKKYQGNQGN